MPRAVNRRTLGLLALLFAGFLVVHNLVPLYTDWLWFGEVGFRRVFTTTIIARTALFSGFGLLFFALFYGNLRLARRMAPEAGDHIWIERLGPALASTIRRAIDALLLVFAVFLSLWAGRIASDHWTEALEFLCGTPFGTPDPVFGIDVGFFVFRLPVLHFLADFLLGALALTGIAVIGIHIFGQAIQSWAGLPQIAAGVRAQLLVLAGALAATLAFQTRLNAYELLFAENGSFTGAGYADLTYRLFARHVEMTVLCLTALACLATLRRGRGFRAPLFGGVAWVGCAVILGQIVPAAGQKLSVAPNESAMEKEFIARNIRYTRQGFGLDQVRRVDNYPADESLTTASLNANRDTLENVRLWDYPYLARVYSQNQTVKNYYKFAQAGLLGTAETNIDIDRYMIGGRKREVMLAARELDVASLPAAAQTWQNQRLAYTHGYGLVMSPVNAVRNGDPVYYLQGFPVTASPEAAALKITRPEIYYGQLAHEYVFVDTQQQEFDYPSTDSAAGAGGTQDHYTSYAGKGGIRIGDAPLAKLAFSLRLGDGNVLLANGFKPETRVLFRRDIRERLQTVAPFVQQDADPYLVIDTASGRLVWIIDCYTLTDRYPYSTPHLMHVNPVTYIAPNYIRNSVKATVDAYDGTVTLYLTDPRDPIARTYGKIFPGLIQPFSAMPQSLRRHVRYPEDLFRIQRSVYAAYHVDDPLVFYRKEDAWAIPVEPNSEVSSGNTNAANQMEPYYVVMHLPDANGRADNAAEFLLMSPLAPINRESQNILGWMCARCDGDRYGELVLYRFPQNRSVTGPSQVIALINNDPVISPQLSLLRTGGSTARFGNLLVIPVERSLLYIAPLYIEATGSASRLPQLQRVVVIFGQKVVMEETLEKALAALFANYTPPEETPVAGTTPSPSPAGSTSSVPHTVRVLVDQASARYRAAQERLKAGDFSGYGAAMKELERILGSLSKAAR